ncbi:RNA polymerase sigma factor [Rufibacter ruber]|uniref:RNA polymerase sigma factor n=1 Tax=Rufibacter ruber TaxID=1783499 RepID=UPI0008352CA7|nr:sigma-70 family RNA polymerase sigma factor [Rufibacter ruber]
MTQSMLVAPAAAEREALFTELYQQVFPAVARYVSRRGGSLDQAKDVFQDTVVVYYEKAANGHTNEIPHVPKYLMGIAKHLWAKRYSQEQQQKSLDPAQLQLETATLEPPTPSVQKVLRFLNTAGQKCMDLLKAFYYDRIPAEEMASSFGFSGPRSATVQKFKCLEKVREAVRTQALDYEDFCD